MAHPGSSPSSGQARHIGLNLLYLVPGAVGGSEIYARELVDALARARPGTRFTVFCGREAAATLPQAGWPDNVHIRPLALHAANKPLRAAAEIALLPWVAAREGVDLLHSLGTTCPPFVPGRPSVVSVLDLIYEAYPDTFPRAARAGLRLLVGPGARRADRVIAISEAVKRDVVDRLGVPADRVDSVLLGRGMRGRPVIMPEQQVRERFALGPGRVILCVSAALAHKNLPRLLEAFSELGDREQLRLVLVGHAGLERASLLRLAQQLNIADRVVMPGWIGADELEGLYAAASVCAYPSLYEGFGMPVLEAMARGVPLVCSNATSLPEVAGSAAILVDPMSAAALAAGLRRVLDDPALATELARKGRERAALFTWERCADGVLATYDRVLRERHR